jgi:hypothetical protein
MSVVTFVDYKVDLFTPKPGGSFGDFLGTIEISEIKQPSGEINFRWYWRGGLFPHENGSFDWVTYDGKLLSIWFDNMVIHKGFIFNYTRWRRIGSKDKLEPPLHPWFKDGDSISGTCGRSDSEMIDFSGKLKK